MIRTGPSPNEVLEQERTDNARVWATVDVTTPLHVEMHPKSWAFWRRYVGQVSGKVVLDIGCGSGLWSVWLASQGANVVCIDLSPVGVNKTLDRARHNGLADRVVAHCLNATDLCRVVQPGSVDLAVGFSVLHHIPVR